MNAEADQPASGNVKIGAIGPSGATSSRILIIDDTRAIHDDFSKILARPPKSSLDQAGAVLFNRESGPNQQTTFELNSAYQGMEGLALVQSAVEADHCYALAFVDVRMPPGWDGVETAAQLWAADPDLQIVICTAYSDQSWQAIVKRLGNRDSLVILKKPFDPIEVLQLAHALTKKWHLTRQNKLRLAELEARVAERTSELQVANEKLLEEIVESRRKQEQMNLQSSALSAAANAILIADSKGKIEWVNPAFTKLTGFSAAEMVGGNPRALKSGQHPPAFYAKLWTTIITGNVWHGELINKRKDGQLYTEDMTVTPVRSADGQIAHFVAIKQDVTEQRQIENRLQQAQKMEAIGTLAGGIAHDFNNILAAIFGYSDLLHEDTRGNPAAQDDIEEIRKAAGRAKDLVRQILTFSRKGEQKRQAIQLGTVVTDALKFLRASLPADITIEQNLAADTPAVLADATQIYQITLNLATNALHAMEGRPGRLTVNLDSFQPDANFVHANPKLSLVPYARLTVADTGHGMNAKTLERIFDPFFTTKPAGKGTGLGLAVVHGLVEAQDGAITVESRPGEGTTFCLFFPARTSDVSSEETQAGELPGGAGEIVLLVDDERALTATFQRMLRRLGYQVVSTNSPREAIQLFHQDPSQFDLVITDFTMPEMNGLELARQIRAVRPDLPVIVASGYAPDLSPEKLQAAGIFELLEKPASMPALANVMHRALSLKP